MNNSVNTGFLLINKPIGISSYGCIGHIKRILKQALHPKVKIGHAGTLDPFASGLLVVAIGREATRLVSAIMVMEKTYVATGKCGELTDTLDLTGSVIETSAVIPTEQAISTALASFGSSYEQIPPLYSALKHQGDPLYALARRGKVDVEDLQEIAKTKKRTVQFYQLDLISYQVPFFTIQTRVSHGTYIRTLINDIAVRAGSCATTYALTRTAIGLFTVEQATTLNDLNTIDDINRVMISSDTVSIE
jgi:tRNA pseudouridine55 synthase